MIGLWPVREVALQVGTFEIRWYGLMYVFGFLLAVLLMPRLQKWRQVDVRGGGWWEVVAWVALGAVLGGRLGYLLIYDWAHFWTEPTLVMKLSEGGMSAHGGVVGVALAIWAAGRWLTKGQYKQLADLIVVPAALGLALGRIGNFINQELYGTITQAWWGVSIPGIDGLRHPWPLYEAAWLIVLAVGGYVALRRCKRAGLVAVGFLILYALGRFGLEFLRQPEWQLVAGLTPGQWWSLGLISCTLFVWRLGNLKKCTNP